MKMTYQAKHLAYIARVTELLNQLPDDDDIYIGVTLYDTHEHQKIGEWSDEIAPDAWYYQEEDA